MPARGAGGGRSRRAADRAGEPLLVRPARRRDDGLCPPLRAQRRALSRHDRRAHHSGGVVHPARLRSQGLRSRGAPGAAARHVLPRPGRCGPLSWRRRLMDGRATTLERADAARRGGTGTRSGRTTGKLVLRLIIMGVLLIVVFGGFYAWQRMRETMTAQFFATMKPPPVPVVAVTATAEAVPQMFAG